MLTPPCKPLTSLLQDKHREVQNEEQRKWHCDFICHWPIQSPEPKGLLFFFSGWVLDHQALVTPQLDDTRLSYSESLSRMLRQFCEYFQLSSLNQLMRKIKFLVISCIPYYSKDDTKLSDAHLNSPPYRPQPQTQLRIRAISIRRKTTGLACWHSFCIVA